MFERRAAGYRYIRLPPDGVSTLHVHNVGAPALDLNRYVYFNSKPGGIAANCVTVCEFHGKTIN